MRDLPPRLELASATCISATLGYEAPGFRRGDGGPTCFGFIPSPDNHATNLNARDTHKELRFTALTYHIFFVVFSGTLVEFARSRRELYV